MKKYISIAISILIFIMVGASFIGKNETVAAGSSSVEVKEEIEVVEEEKTIFIEIKGAVKVPGVYEVESDKRVFDIIELAGGLLEDANIDYLNQTRILEDQMLIVIMTNVQIQEAIEAKELSAREASETSIAEPQIDVVGYDDCYNGGSTQSASSSLISLNNASKEELMNLSGIGEARATDIITYRNQNGGFKSIEELMEVNGIGEATFNKIRDYITL